MKVKDKYCSNDDFFDVTTEQLIEYGCSPRDGQIESLEDQVKHLTKIIAALIDRSDITDRELLKLTDCQWKYAVAGETK